MRSIDGAADVSTEQITGQPMLQIKVDAEQVARYGLSAQAVLDLVQSIGSKPLGDMVEGQLRFPLVARLPESFRASPAAIGAMLVATASGERIPLSRLATVEIVEGPSTITREWGQRRITVTSNVRGRDLGSFVAEARRQIAEKVALPTGRYRVEYGGQFENLNGPDAADDRCPGRTPFDFRAALLHLSQPGRCLAGFHRYSFRLGRRHFCPVAAGHAVFDFGRRWIHCHVGSGGAGRHDPGFLYPATCASAGFPLDEAVTEAAVTRLRPVLMTTLVASLGFLPMAFSDGMGAEVQRPLATVVIGGVIGAMVMSLLVLRVLYLLFNRPTPGTIEPVDARQSADQNELVNQRELVSADS